MPASRVGTAQIATRYPELWDRLQALRRRGVSSLASEYQDILGQVLPELEWAFGYPLVLAVMVLICLALYRGFRRSGWL